MGSLRAGSAGHAAKVRRCSLLYAGIRRLGRSLERDELFLLLESDRQLDVARTIEAMAGANKRRDAGGEGKSRVEPHLREQIQLLFMGVVLRRVSWGVAIEEGRR